MNTKLVHWKLQNLEENHQKDVNRWGLIWYYSTGRQHDKDVNSPVDIYRVIAISIEITIRLFIKYRQDYSKIYRERQRN